MYYTVIGYFVINIVRRKETSLIRHEFRVISKHGALLMCKETCLFINLCLVCYKMKIS